MLNIPQLKKLLRKIIGDKLYTYLKDAIIWLTYERIHVKRALGDKYSDCEHVSRLKADIRLCRKAYGTDISDYFTFDFLNKSSEEKGQYVTEESRFKYYKILNKRENDNVFNDKYRTYIKFQPFYLREVVLLSDASDKSKYYEFIKKNPCFVAKTCYGASGKGVSVVIVEEGKERSVFKKLVQKMPLVLEERIIQKDSIAVFHQKSINTCRITTILYDDCCHVINPAIRIGRGDSIVDNAGAGGLYAPIDAKTGKILQDAFDIYGHRYRKHPESNIVFKGFIVPEWEGALALVEKLCRVVPTNRFTGWDLALSDKGWIMVEGNCLAQFKNIQASGGVKEMMDSICEYVMS